LRELAAVDLTDVHGLVLQQTATCEVLIGWATACQGDADGVQLAFQGMATIDTAEEKVLRSALRTFVGHALIEAGDADAVGALATARHEGESRGEVWWLPETIRLQAVADRMFGDGSQAEALLDEAEALATVQGALVVLPRIAASRVDLAAR
jgi:hypothetical protein